MGVSHSQTKVLSADHKICQFFWQILLFSRILVTQEEVESAAQHHLNRISLVYYSQLYGIITNFGIMVNFSHKRVIAARTIGH